MAFEDFLPAETYTPTPRTIAHKNSCNLEQLIKKNFARPVMNKDTQRMTVTEILDYVGLTNPRKSQLNQTGKILRELNIETKKSNGLTQRLVMLIN